MLGNRFEADIGGEGTENKTFIVKRISLLFNDRECQTLNFIDITAQKSLKQVQQRTEQLSALSASVHHEMLGPLKSNVDLANALMRHLSTPALKKQAQLI